MMDKMRSSSITAVTIGTGSLAIFIWWWFYKGKKVRLPNEWYKVGEISDIFVFPIKSLGCVNVTSVECTILGCKVSEWIRDRTLMVIDLNKKFVTARKYPKMVQISPSVTGSVLTLEAPGMVKISTDLAQVGKVFKSEVWGQKVPACDCGDEIAQWLSRFILEQDTGLRLVYYPLDKSSRDIRPNNRLFPLLKSVDSGAYPDCTSYNLINEASIADLNTKVEDPVTPLQFRPNFVVKGPKPLEEDTWDWIKIGSVIFRNIKPCTRCIFTTINPSNGCKHPKQEPLKILKEYRQIENPEFRSSVGDSPVMGIHLGLKGPNGIVKLGDPVYLGKFSDD
ncbi:mitochondrial amidoxime reducing component 2-like [Chelonus insularis]|uniref:mitochondrial amidoxime reducing component 2-like n=1 Tax=Chelonus insularis TaxID=460826 RepID=UPI00158F0F6C|nr:mitochondrial amidoxime reducing component 2-like [Chelonus insularis]